MYCTDTLSVSIFNSLKFGLFSANVPVLVYYSHFTGIIVSLLLSLFLLYSNRKSLAAKSLVFISIIFSIWSVCDVFLWTQIDSRIIMFLWSYWALFFVGIFVSSFYFMYVFIKKHDAPFVWKTIFALVLLSILVVSATKYNISGFDIPGCSAIEFPPMLVVDYVLSLLILFSICFFGVREYRREKNEEQKKQILLSSLGVVLFLLSFSIATWIANIANLFNAQPDTFSIEQYGFFGMSIFIGFLTYLVVRYKAFNVKLLGAQALVLTIVILIGSEFFFIRSQISQVLVSVTLVFTIVFGYQLIKGVKREIEAKEKIQKLAHELDAKNVRLLELDKQKNEFVSFATHQLRSPLTAIKGNTSLILEGDLGQISEPLREIVQTVYTSVKTLISVVEDYLNISRMELGTMKYNMVDMDFKVLLQEVMSEQKPNMDLKGLSYSMEFDGAETYKIKADPDKFKQVVMNTIDNSIKYTPKGSIKAVLTKDAANGMVRLAIVDTGVGIDPRVMPKLFQKFTRAPNASEANIHGTGLGLFIAKEIVAAHGGKVWAESAGEGKGSQFYIEVPEVK